ncbi:MAG TPA: PEP-CTERM sorting domain-containing protein [Cyanobacteria bacterium UBA12227]|nr:PEP-CTERM sorting domain-containing protein [Cyanobacteria bacterium UBA12227]HAX89290.1 PEP-CTERM sorting domain-containing protein [Cyanobacteria bacterium UBA11370]HBY78878.1 PEP-CTERM sorting domain-containing protein [Cyanobacteria bacterium UBA11148]
MKTSIVVGSALIAASCSLSVFSVSSSANAAALTPVDLELSFLVDVSGSVDSGEFNLQQNGYVDVFNNPDLFNNFISKGQLGTIAVNLIYWSSEGEQQEAVGWTLIDSVAASQSFANAISAAGRPFFGLTAPGSAIAFATPRFFNNDFDGTRLVIDVSGDGAENDGLDTATARDNALAAGIDAINGLVIGGNPFVLDFYNNEVKGGPNSFVVQTDDFADFGTTIAEKIKREIVQDVPEPASVFSLLAFGLLGTSSKLKRQQKN